MQLNLSFYKNKEEVVTDEEQEIIDKYIDKIDTNEYENEFSDIVTDKEIYYLSSSSQNILNWYPFEKESSVLEIGGDLGQLTQVFINQCRHVVTVEPNLIKAEAISKRYDKQENLEIIVGNLKDIKIDRKFNYITLIGIINRIEQIMGQDIKLTDLIKTIEPYLEENGKILVAVDNKFGLRNFVGDTENILDKKFVSINGYNNEPKKIETFTKLRLERKLKEIGYNANFYYPLPDYKLPNVIFSDMQLPKYNNIDKYIPYHTKKSTIIMNEIDVFREILKDNENLFQFFTNSFLIEVSKNKEPIKYKYISFNNCRKQEYRLITKIGDEYVEKQVTSKHAEKHYENIKQNTKQLVEQNIKTVDYEEDGKIRSKYCSQECLLNNVITKALEEKNQEFLEKVMNQYIDILNTNTYIEENYEKTVFYKYKIDIENPDIIKELHFKENGLWDMTFKNCFYIDGEMYFFDQEWNEPNLPVEYILYRSILYTISLRRFINIEDWFEKYGLNKFRTIFEKLDEKLQENIRDNKIWSFYSENHDFNIDETKQEVINLNLRNSAQGAFLQNMQEENEKLKLENEKLQAKIQEMQNKSFLYRVKRKINKIVGEKSDE